MSTLKNVYFLGASTVEFHDLDSSKRPSEISKIALDNCLKKCGLDRSNVDFLISASSTPDYNNPSLAQTLLGRYEAFNIGAIEIRQSASGLHFAMALGANFIRAGIYKTVAIICTDLLGRMYQAVHGNDADDSKLGDARSVSSDGVFAAILCGDETLKQSAAGRYILKLEETLLGSSHTGAETFTIESPSSSQCPERITLSDYKANKHVAKIDRERFATLAKDIFLPHLREFMNSSKREFKFSIFHSPVPNLLQKLDSHFSFSDEVEKIGYMGSAGAGISLLRMLNEENCSSGDRLLLAALGAGFNWGIQALEVV